MTASKDGYLDKLARRQTRYLESDVQARLISEHFQMIVLPLWENCFPFSEAI